MLSERIRSERSRDLMPRRRLENALKIESSRGLCRSPEGDAAVKSSGNNHLMRQTLFKWIGVIIFISAIAILGAIMTSPGRFNIRRKTTRLVTRRHEFSKWRKCCGMQFSLKSTGRQLMTCLRYLIRSGSGIRS